MKITTDVRNFEMKFTVTPSRSLVPTTRTSLVSFTNDNQGYAGKTTKPISLHPVPKAEITELKTLDKDCFIIPVASVDRFLPAGVPMPLIETKQSQLSVVEVDDPKLCVLIHLMTQMEPIEPILESPLSLPLAKQKITASDLLTEVGASRTAMEGMLLANLEKNAEFPFISYYVINKAQTDPGEFFHNCRAASLRKFDPKCLRYTAVHTFDLFNEVATIARPPLDPTSKRPRSNATGFIVSVYKVFEGDDGEKFEKNWLYWTGARMIYRSLPKSVGLRRITLHKSVSSGDKLYLLLVECSNFLSDLTAAAVLIPALRARLCGYTGLYRTTAYFSEKESGAKLIGLISLVLLGSFGIEQLILLVNNTNLDDGKSANVVENTKLASTFLFIFLSVFGIAWIFLLISFCTGSYLLVTVATHFVVFCMVALIFISIGFLALALAGFLSVAFVTLVFMLILMVAVCNCCLFCIASSICARALVMPI